MSSNYTKDDAAKDIFRVLTGTTEIEVSVPAGGNILAWVERTDEGPVIGILMENFAHKDSHRSRNFTSSYQTVGYLKPDETAWFAHWLQDLVKEATDE